LYSFVGFEVFTAVVMKSIIFWDMTPCSLLSVNRRFGGTYRLHLQGRRNKFGKKPASKQVASLSVDTQWTTRRHIPEDDTLVFFCQKLYFTTYEYNKTAQSQVYMFIHLKVYLC
jgi:hypothetical protein